MDRRIITLALAELWHAPGRRVERGRTLLLGIDGAFSSRAAGAAHTLPYA